MESNSKKINRGTIKIDITMEYLSLDQVKQNEHDILKYGVGVCKENSI